MDGEGLGILSILGFLPFILIVGIYLGFLLTRSWQNSARNGLVDLRNRLKDFQKENNRIRNNASFFSVTDPEPFGPLYQNLTETLTEIDQFLLLSFRNYGNLREQFQRLREARLNQVIRLPYDWLMLVNALKRQDQRLDQVYELFDKARTIEQELSQTHWRLAQECQRCMAVIAEIEAKLDDEGKFHLTDEDLTFFKEKIGDWKTTITQQAPAFFFSSSPEVIAQKADKATTARVYRMMQNLAPALSSLHGEINEIYKCLEDLAALLKSIAQKNAAVMALSKALSGYSEFPIHLEKTQKKLAKLTDLVESFHPEETQRLRHAIKRESAALKKVEAEFDDIYAHLQSLCAAREDIIKLWALPELDKGHEWTSHALAMMPEMLSYSPQNWSRNFPGELQAELGQLMELQKRIHRRGLSNPLLEGEVESYLKSVQDLVSFHQYLRPRFSEAVERYNQIQELEKDCREKLRKAQALIQRLAPLSASNTFLKKTIGLELEKYHEKVRSLLILLDDRAVETVERKVKKVNQALAALQKSLGEWLASLRSENIRNSQKLRQVYDDITQLATLDDAVISQAEKFLRQSETSLDDLPAAALPLLDLGKALIKESETWQNGISLLSALQDLANPFLERFKKLENYRRTAQEQLARAEKIMPDELTWPATTQFLTNERSRFDAYEDQFQTIRQMKQQPLALMNKLSDLTENYQELSLSLREKLTTAEKEQEKIREYEDRLESSKKMWLEVIAAHRGNRNLERDIRQFLAGLDSEYQELIRRYERGSLPYQQSLNSLRLLCRKADETLMPFYDSQSGESRTTANKVVDINGSIQPRNY